MNRSTLFQRIRAHGAAAVLVVAFACAACGGGSAKGGAGDGATAGTGGAGGGQAGSGGATDNTPVGLCKQLITTLCTRSNECKASDAGVVDVAQCSTLQDVAFGCDRASSTAFAACLSDVKTLSCTGLFSPTNGLVLPGSCDVPTNIPPSDAQTKCANLVEVICDPTDLCSNVVPTQTQALMTCETDGIQQIGCAFAVSVSTTYNQCLSDLCATPDAGTDGGTGASAPASCNAVIIGPKM
jgi:hypothetical protein